MSNSPIEVLNTVVQQITGVVNPLSLDAALKKFAFDVRIPEPVVDALTGETGWAQSTAPVKFVTNATVTDKDENYWIKPTVFPKSLEHLLELWSEVNFTSSSRHIESINVHESDNIYNSENVYQSVDISRSKNVLWCDGVMDSQYVVASQRSHACEYGLRIEDSKECSESIGVSWSHKVVKSAFIHNCSDMYESIFCSHLVGKRYCIANMQFEEADYFKLKAAVMRWIFSPIL